MNEILQLVLKHGYSFLFAVVFLRQIGLPLPEPMFLVAAGALAAAGKLAVPAIVGLTVIACVSADWVWYLAGRRRGDKVLNFMHRFTRDPDSHNRRAKRAFERYGLPLLLVAKFVPGLDAVAPPLAGTSCTSPVRFLAMDALGAGLYACVYCGLGYVFCHDLNHAAAYVPRAGTLLLGFAALGVGVYYTTRKLVQYLRLCRGSQFPRITPDDPIPIVEPADMHCGILGGQENGN